MKRSAILQVFVFSFALCNAYGAAGGFPVHSPYIAPLSAAEKKEFMAKYPEYTKSINLIRANLKLIKMYCLHEFEENENRK